MAETSARAAAEAKRLFFEAVRGLDEEHRSRLLCFVTALHRLPAGGFAALTPPFTLQLLGPQFGADRLPVPPRLTSPLPPQISARLPSSPPDRAAHL